MDKPLPRIGVDKLYWAKLLTDTSSGATYDTPVHLKGVTSVGYNPNSQVGVFYADDGAYEAYSQDGEADVTISVADLEPQHYAELMGVTRDSNGLIKEGNNDNAPEGAIGYRTQKSNGEYRYIWFYKGKFSKPQVNAETKGNAPNFQQQEITYKGLNRDYDGYKRRRFDSDDDDLPVGLTNTILASDVSGWFSTPDYVPTAPGTPLSDVAAVTGVGGSGTIDLTFTAAAGATSIKAQIYDAAYGEWKDATTSAAITASSTAATITGLTAGNTYTCRLVVNGGTSNGISNTDDAAAAA